jgi:lipid II:glycine glycyltransferase (peptidoglycan interpeptide bridge formation enzyme)
MPEVTSQEWNAFLADCPSAHVLQTSAWGDLKASFGWDRLHILAEKADRRAGALLLFLRLPLGWSLAYLPKGPVSPGSDSLTMAGFNQLWEVLSAEVDQICRSKRAIFLKVEPDLIDPADGAAAPSTPLGFQPSPHAIQPPRTILVDLAGTDDDILGCMKQKTRYNLRLAQKKGLQVEQSTDIAAFYQLMQVTGQRDVFAVHSQAYYQRAFDLFSPGDQCNLLLATFEGELLGGLMVFIHGSRAWYFYGASSSQRRELMAPYLLQWEAMRWARAKGCAQYDLWGIPDLPEADLEAQFSSRGDGLWGVYRFKRGFGGQVCRAAGPWDRVYQPWLYQFYLWRMKSRATGENGLGG